MEENLDHSFKATIASDEALNLAKEYSEIALDSVLKDGLLKNIPVFGTLISLYKMCTSLKDRHTIKKLLVFLNRSADIPRKDRDAFLTKLDKQDKYQETVAEKVLLLIERLDETQKAEIVGNLFRLVVMGIISKDHFLRLSGIVERALLYDLLALYYRYSWFGKDWNGDKPYHVSATNEPALAAHGLMALKIGSEPSKTARANGLLNSGLTDPTLAYQISPLGQELANLMIYDLKNRDFQDYINEMKERQAVNVSSVF